MDPRQSGECERAAPSHPQPSHQLYADVLSVVFTFFTLRDRQNAARVCRRWKRAAESGTSYDTTMFCYYSAPPLFPSPVLRRHTKHVAIFHCGITCQLPSLLIELQLYVSLRRLRISLPIGSVAMFTFRSSIADLVNLESLSGGTTRQNNTDFYKALLGDGFREMPRLSDIGAITLDVDLLDKLIRYVPRLTTLDAFVSAPCIALLHRLPTPLVSCSIQVSIWGRSPSTSDFMRIDTSAIEIFSCDHVAEPSMVAWIATMPKLRILKIHFGFEMPDFSAFSHPTLEQFEAFSDCVHISPERLPITTRNPRLLRELTPSHTLPR